MSLVWMGGITVAIFNEKVGCRPLLATRAIGILFVVAGALVLVRALRAFVMST